MRGGRADRLVMGEGRRQCGAALFIASLLVAGGAWGQAGPVRMNGVPEQIIPRVFDVGLGSFEIVPGTGVVVGGTPAPGAGGGEGMPAGASAALDVMSGRSWGDAASQHATLVGVNPSALAATCMVESGCQNVAARDGSRIRGAFQMYDPTFESGLTRAVGYNPALQGAIQRGVDGSMDPANQAISAAATIRSEAERLQRAGISNPTVLDVRGGYNFGSGYTIPLAQADGGQLMRDVLDGYTPAQLAANGISPTTTVADWRSTVSARMGDAALQPVLVSNGR
ncbi:hypothetical protein GXW71_10065 [Roseomonas hellenica]|uniref:Transglycosylase SLT domain-containing protein n=1 Tax=Plastoroseomonas hellenica TaxID=2687306 RepID=A0ABS5EWM1_9PROT|nr:hypothetical protein [Plastoroseomonas hellenica]MBR0664696.1 hypothetical protein [Plastoroseomonas hellenica]